MFGQEGFQNEGYVMIPPQDFDDAAVGSAWIYMKEYGHATAILTVGDTAGASMAVTLNQATDNAGSGEKTLAFTRIMSSGQKLLINTVSGTFQVGETVTGGTSSLTAEVYEVGPDYMWVRNLTNGTTWTTTETVTGSTSAATCKMNGTGEAENVVLPTYTAPSSTFTIPATTYKMYVLEIDAESLDVDNGFDFIQVDVADPGAATLAAGIIVLKNPRKRGIPMPDALETQKMTSTF